MKRNYKDIYGYRMKNRTGEWKKQEKRKICIHDKGDWETGDLIFDLQNGI